jgi:hypothetical protein
LHIPSLPGPLSWPSPPRTLSISERELVVWRGRVHRRVLARIRKQEQELLSEERLIFVRLLILGRDEPELILRTIIARARDREKSAQLIGTEPQTTHAHGEHHFARLKRLRLLCRQKVLCAELEQILVELGRHVARWHPALDVRGGCLGHLRTKLDLRAAEAIGEPLVQLAELLLLRRLNWLVPSATAAAASPPITAGIGS